MTCTTTEPRGGGLELRGTAAHGRVDERLQVASGARVGEHDAAQRRPVEGAVLAENGVAEPLRDLSEQRGAVGDDVTGEYVGVDDHSAAGREQRRDAALAVAMPPSARQPQTGPAGARARL